MLRGGIKRCIKGIPGTEGEEQAPEHEKTEEDIPTVQHPRVSRLQGHEEDPEDKRHQPRVPTEEQGQGEEGIHEEQARGEGWCPTDQVEGKTPRLEGLMQDEMSRRHSVVGVEGDEVGGAVHKIPKDQEGQSDSKDRQGA